MSEEHMPLWAELIGLGALWLLGFAFACGMLLFMAWMAGF